VAVPVFEVRAGVGSLNKTKCLGALTHALQDLADPSED